MVFFVSRCPQKHRRKAAIPQKAIRRGHIHKNIHVQGTETIDIRILIRRNQVITATVAALIRT